MEKLLPRIESCGAKLSPPIERFSCATAIAAGAIWNIGRCPNFTKSFISVYLFLTRTFLMAVMLAPGTSMPSLSASSTAVLLSALFNRSHF